MADSKRGPVTQKEMAEYYRILMSYVDARDRMLAVQAKLVLALNQGVGQEPGKYRLVKKSREMRRISWKEEFINVRGEKAAVAILQAAKPKRYYRLVFEPVINR